VIIMTTQRRSGSERDAAQPISGGPRAADEPADVQNPDDVPSNLGSPAERKVTRESDDPLSASERHASASFLGADTDPPISDRNPPRGKRGLTPTEDAPRETPGRKKE
jgi:hypothetical protein